MNEGMNITSVTTHTANLDIDNYYYYYEITT